LISPPAAVFEIAPAKVLHGAVRLHGLTSSPTPETQVLVACAAAAKPPAIATARPARIARLLILIIASPPEKRAGIYQFPGFDQPPSGELHTKRSSQARR